MFFSEKKPDKICSFPVVLRFEIH